MRALFLIALVAGCGFFLFRTNAARTAFAVTVSFTGKNKTLAPHARRGGFSRYIFYPQNHFRILISHAVVEFYRGAAIPSELAAGETQLYARILETNAFSVRRWLATSEGWNDDDQPFVNTVTEGDSADTFPLLRV
jgi:hypothetical protein